MAVRSDKAYSELELSTWFTSSWLKSKKFIHQLGKHVERYGNEQRTVTIMLSLFVESK